MASERHSKLLEIAKAYLGKDVKRDISGQEVMRQAREAGYANNISFFLRSKLLRLEDSKNRTPYGKIPTYRLEERATGYVWIRKNCRPIATC